MINSTPCDLYLCGYEESYFELNGITSIRKTILISKQEK